jgi:uncharacterized protein YecE (DUF72 family)
VTPLWRTTDWSYVRFHGGRAKPRPCYGERSLAGWVTRLVDGWGRDHDGFFYFNNDHQGCALRDAATFGHLLEEDGVSHGRLPHIGDEVLTILPAKDPDRPHG